MAGSARSQSYAVRPRVVGRYLGQLMCVLAVLTIAPLIVALIAGDWAIAGRLGIVAAALGAGCAGLCRFETSDHLQRNEALAISAGIFVIASVAMAWPMMGAGLGVADAFFESVSGVTTTGLTTTATVEDKPVSFLFLRAWMQWYGGLGIVVLSLAIVTRPGVASKRLSMVEDIEHDLLGGTRSFARKALVFYMGFTIVAFLGILLAGGGAFSSLVHALSAVSTGGFSSNDNSLAGLGSSAAAGVTLVFSALGAISFAVFLNVRRAGLASIYRDIECRSYLAIALAAAAAIAMILQFQTDLGWLGALGQGASFGFTAQSTTGYSTAPVAGLPAAAKLVIMLSMLVGANLGSTGGGLKIVRFLLLLSLMRNALARTAVTEHTVLEPRLHGTPLRKREIESALLIILAYFGLSLITWLLFLLAGHDPLDSLFDIVSAIGTVGLSTGVTSPDLSPALKLALCVNMLLGRLEILAVIVLIYPRTWIGKRGDTAS